MRKPIQVYQPEFAQVKPKKREFSVNCKILKSKKLPHNGKTFNFTATSNLSAGNILKKFMREASLEQFECLCIYYSEEQQSNQYLGWKKLRSIEQLSTDYTYKIRIYKKKKMEKIPQVTIKKCESKEPKPEKILDAPKIEEYSSTVNSSEIGYNSMEWYYYYMLWMRSNFMLTHGFQF